MEQRIIQFIHALRAEGIPVSLAESTDAFRAISHLGIQDRQAFRIGLRSAIAKGPAAQNQFDALFPLFFGTGIPPLLQNLAEQLSEQEAELLDQFRTQLERILQELLHDLLTGDKLNPELLDSAAQQSGLSHADSRRQQEWLARRMENLLQLPALRALLEEIEALLGPITSDARAQAIAQGLERNLSAWQQQIREFVGGQIAGNLAQQSSPAPRENLTDRPFTSLTERDMQQLRQEVRRLAIALKSRIALRQRNARTGAIHLKLTMRANQKYGGVPVELKYRKRDRKPKIVVLCDLSTSMRYCSELMLSLLFELSNSVQRTHAFAFISRLTYISPQFIGRTVSEAIEVVLRNHPPGYYSTDLGSSLLDFDRDHLSLLDNQTNLIILGDGRNNYNNPQLETFRKLSRRAQNTFWVNPEPTAQWGTGDSDIFSYRPFCTKIVTASNLRQLSQAVDQLLI